MKKIYTADELNAIPRWTYNVLEKPDNIEFGQIWSINPDIYKWLLNKNDRPPLFPVVISDEESGIPGTVNVIPLNSLTNTASSDDLFLSDEDGEAFKESMISLWSERTMHTKYLFEYIGFISNETKERIKLIKSNKIDTFIRDYTGTPIVKGNDYRIPFRDEFIYMTEILSASLL